LITLGEFVKLISAATPNFNTVSAANVTGSARDSRPKVFCFFSSEKKTLP
jgi:hypothetical protein